MVEGEKGKLERWVERVKEREGEREARVRWSFERAVREIGRAHV